MSRVAFVENQDRTRGVKASLTALGSNPVKGKDVLIKPNFNTADPAPGSTDNETLITLVDEIWKMGANSITLGERSYPPTQEVMEKKGIIPLLKEKNVKIINFDDLKKKGLDRDETKGQPLVKRLQSGTPDSGGRMPHMHLLSEDPSVRRCVHFVS